MPEEEAMRHLRCLALTFLQQSGFSEAVCRAWLKAVSRASAKAVCLRAFLRAVKRALLIVLSSIFAGGCSQFFFNSNAI